MASCHRPEQRVFSEQLVHQAGCGCGGRALSRVSGGEGEDGGLQGSGDLGVRLQGQDHPDLRAGGRHVREGGHDGGLVDGREPSDLPPGLVRAGGPVVVAVVVVVVVVLVIVQVSVSVLVVQD